MDKKVKRKVTKKDIAKAYERYTKRFTPKPAYFMNCIKAFLVGGGICTLAFYINNLLVNTGMKEKDAETYVTIGIIVLAQLLTGLGVFDRIAKFAGAGIIVPISGFANSMVAPAIEYKKDERDIIGLSRKAP